MVPINPIASLIVSRVSEVSWCPGNLCPSKIASERTLRTRTATSAGFIRRKQLTGVTKGRTNLKDAPGVTSKQQPERQSKNVFGLTISPIGLTK